jgi:hypothetical protein
MCETINLNKEIRFGYSIIENIVYKNDGIIFGGFVRDEILKDHAINEFCKMFCKQEDLINTKMLSGELKDKFKTMFWDKNIDYLTIDRQLNPNDIDIYFSDLNKSEKFIDDLIKINNSIFDVLRFDKSDLYILNEEINHITIEASVYLGRTLLKGGTRVSFKIDICIHPTMEPPFKNLDAYTNILLKDKYGIRVSSDCSMITDKCRSYEKNMLCCDIIKMVIEKKNMIVQKPKSLNEATRLLKRIGKMVENKIIFSNIGWMDFEIGEEMCLICQDEGAHLSIMKNSHFHRKCFNEYVLNTEVTEEETEQTDDLLIEESRIYFFKSPMRENCKMQFVKKW